jgi:CRISPR-associated endonuclease/helicase Cas3
MIHELIGENFAVFFKEVHGYPPFPWQTRLARKLAQESTWPEVLELPTGSGKTAALDVAVFHLALEAVRGPARRAPIRIAMVVDRRLVVDDAFARAEKIAKALAKPTGTVTAEVARRLKLLAGEDAAPLVARRLRGGIPREDDWARTPSQPTILCSTVDQVGSRLLFRGYGVSDSMKPVHAGIFGSDCLILLDEAHLSEPFRQTLGWVKRYKGNSWRESKDAIAPWGLSLLTATPGKEVDVPFGLDDEDYANSILRARWGASKPALLIELGKPKQDKDAANDDEEAAEPDKVADKQRIDEFVKQAVKGLEALKERGLDHPPVLAVVVNRVARARGIFEELRKRPDAEEIESILMIGPSRSIERNELAKRLYPIKTGNPRNPEKPLLIVSTQCIEAGVDIDLDGLITEAAPLDALRQRFGRLNRAGRKISPYAAIIGSGGKADAKDPVYGDAIVKTWNYLKEHADKPATKKELPKVDFGLAALEEHLKKHPVVDPLKPEDLLSPKADAPVLLPAHLDLLSQTAPIPTADPEVSLYLHGPSRTADSVSVVWRADVDPEFHDGTYRLMSLVPPRAAETIELPVWAVRRWLNKERSSISELADVPISEPDENGRAERYRQEQKVFRWTGKEDSSEWIHPKMIHPGDTVVVPTAYGGIDEYGWNPDAPSPAKDVAAQAATPYEGRRFVVRVAPGLLKSPEAEAALAQAIAGADTKQWRALRDAIPSSGLSTEIAADLEKLDKAKGKVEAYTELYGSEDDLPRGVVFVAPRGIKIEQHEEAAQEDSPNATEDDFDGSLPGFAVPLQQHCSDVEEKAYVFSTKAGLSPERIQDLKLAGYLHDAGKADARFQSWLAYGDPLGPDLDCPDGILAKSARPLPRNAREYSGLPAHWRHEALSVRLAPHMPRFAEAKDPELVLWLIGTHHGYGRPFFPHADRDDTKERTELPAVLGIPSTLAAGPGPQSLAYECEGRGLDWPSLYELLKARYGVWELARMEAILRLADHRASEEESAK